MSNDEAERRIEAARVDALRQKETAEFLQSLKPGDEMMRQIINPEAWAMRDKFKAAATRGELPRTDCSHPMALLQQYIDDDPLIKRAGRPVNLFECGVCHMAIWFTDPWGKALSDD